MNVPKSIDNKAVSIRTYILYWLMGVTVFTFTMKYYQGPGEEFINHWGPASVGYVIFFMLGIIFFIPRYGAILPVTLTVLSLTCLLEFAQRWQPVWLQGIRETFLGKALIGSTFSWLDFPAYFVGALFGASLLHFLLRPSRIHP